MKRREGFRLRASGLRPDRARAAPKLVAAMLLVSCASARVAPCPKANDCAQTTLYFGLAKYLHDFDQRSVMGVDAPVTVCF